MYIANCEAVSAFRGILDYMPREIRRYFFNVDLSDAYEVRLCLGQPVCIYFRDGRYFLGSKGQAVKNPLSAVRVTRKIIDEALELAVKSSLYSVKDDITNGFITVAGGHRIGISGSAVVKDGKISFIKDISALCYRIAGEVIGAADPVMDLIVKDGEIQNTLIISPPGGGKTTLLRDIARQLSYGGYRVSIVDERREIAAVCEGRSGFDLGYSADVMDGADKADGMLMMLRSMSPDVIVTDEIGTAADAAAIEKIILSGVKIITSVHAASRAQVEKRRDLKDIFGFFEAAVTLSGRGEGRIKEAVELDG